MGMKTTRFACAWIFAALSLCGCERDNGGADQPATAATEVAPETYAVPYAMPESGVMEYELEVTVQSNSGLVLVGALVQVVADDCYGSQQANTDEWGRAYFNFCVQPGSWVYIDAISSGFAPSAVDLLTGDDPCPTVSIYLAPMVVVESG